jgi:hypothetical protein
MRLDLLSKSNLPIKGVWDKDYQAACAVQQKYQNIFRREEALIG